MTKQQDIGGNGGSAQTVSSGVNTFWNTDRTQVMRWKSIVTHVHGLSRHTPEQVRNRFLAIGLFSIILLSVYPLIDDSSYRGSSDFHATIEMVGACFAIIAGLALIVHFYSFGDRLYLLIGLAFFINGVEDFFHGLLSFRHVQHWTGLPESSLEQFIPMTFVTGRILLGVFLLMAPMISRRLGKSEDPKKETIWTATISIIVLALFIIMAFKIALPDFIHPDKKISRPWDFISALILFAALGVFGAEYHRSREMLLWWITLSIAVNAIGQLMMSFSGELYDGFFDIAHEYKVLGYVIPLLGFSLYQFVIISERQQIEDELRRSTGELDQIFNNSPDGIRVIDRHFNIIRANDTFALMVGLDKEEISRRKCYDVFSSELCRSPNCPMNRILAGEGRIEEEVEKVRRDRRTLPCVLTAIPFRDPDGKVVGIVEDINDITERMKAERKLKRIMSELVRSNNELEQFAYIASHDLQEPLRMVSSYVQLLSMRYKGQLDSDADDFISFAVDGAMRMQELINDLLQFARVSTKGKTLKKVDLNNVMTKVLTDMRTAIDESGARITYDELPEVNADDVQMGQVFRNLIGNAIKFSGTRRPLIEISVEKQRNNWIMTFSDNGIGIDPEYQDRIFIIFQRLHGIDEFEGTGIGLALTKKIIERHGGRIWVESIPGEGSSFFITLPSRDLGYIAG